MGSAPTSAMTPLGDLGDSANQQEIFAAGNETTSKRDRTHSGFKAYETAKLLNRRIQLIDINLFPKSSGAMSEQANERMSAAERASEASSAEQENE